MLLLRREQSKTGCKNLLARIRAVEDGMAGEVDTLERTGMVNNGVGM
jgi:hypothetical protein